jgi:hypothetical protein
MPGGKDKRTLPAEICETKKECYNRTDQPVITSRNSQKEEENAKYSNSL